MPNTSTTDLAFLTQSQVLAGLLGRLRTNHGGYRIVEHWKQGEFHHDLVLKVQAPTGELPGDILVVSTNCNGRGEGIVVLRPGARSLGLVAPPLPGHCRVRG